MVLRNSGRVGSRRLFLKRPAVRFRTGGFLLLCLLDSSGNLFIFAAELFIINILKQIESMKTKILLAAAAVAFSFVVTSCGNKKAESNASDTDSCCAAKTEQVCDSTKACCKAEGDSAKCEKACDKPCDKKECDKACDKK